jgi:excisionase family DNA binding protein
VTHPSATTSAANPTSAEGRLLLTVEEAADQLGVGRTVMYRLLSSGAVKSVTLGRLRRIPRECLSDFVADLRSHQAENGHPQGGAA